MFRPLIASALVALSLAAGGVAAASAPGYVARAVADPSRPKDHIAADAIRAPAETLVFAGVKPGMIVAEMFPAGGYFTRMISVIVGPTGKVIGIENATWKGAVKADEEMLAGPGLDNVELRVAPFGELPLTEKVDLVFVAQNYHDLKIAQYGVVDTAAFNRKVFQALKPGGTFFVTDHEANPGTTTQQIEKLHRIEKAQVIREVTAAGFRLAGEGSFLRRPADDHTLGIFDKTIQGKTDQYALKFVKPAG